VRVCLPPLFSTQKHRLTKLKKQSLTQKTLNSGAWQSATVFFQGTVQLVVIAVLARLLTPADFGLVAIANLVIGFAAFFTRFGLVKAIIQKKELTEIHIRVGFTAAFAMAFLIAAILFLLAPFVARFFDNADVTPIMRVLSFSFILSNLGTVSEALLTRELAFKKLFWVTIWTYTFGYALVGIGLAALGYGVWALVLAALATKFVHSVVLLIMQPHAKRPSFQRQELGELLNYGGGVTLSALFKYGANNGDYLIIGRWLGPVALGIYQQAFNILVIFARYLGEVLENVLFATASLIQDQQQRLSRAYSHSLSLINLLLLPITVLMIVLAPEIVLVYLGNQWLEAILPTQILLVGLTFRSQSRISDAFVHATGEVYKPAIRKAVFIVLVVLGSWVGQHWGIIGVAVAVTLAMIIDCFLVLDLGLRFTGLRARDYLLGMLPGAHMSGLVLLLCLPLTLWLRSMIDSPLVVLLITLFVTGSILFGLVLAAPAILGKNGVWFVNQALGMLPQRRWIVRYRTVWLSRRVQA
jgi:O-antigen/teichoic acid export membrane protein